MTAATRSSWPPRWREHAEGDIGCMCPACGHYRRISSLSFLERFAARLDGVVDNDVEADPYFDWSAPMPVGETELSGHEPGFHDRTGSPTVPARAVRHG